jgi:putative methanogenesis marker protein 8
MASRYETTDRLFARMGIRRGDFEDLHLTRMFSSFVAVSGGRVIAMTEPFLRHCPLANLLYEDLRGEGARLKEGIRKAVEEKIERFGHFTGCRELERDDIAVPLGASEMVSCAMRKGIIDSAVLVCDGAGTVVTDRPEVVQGIGARMNGLFYTTPLRRVIEGLEARGGRVVFPDTAGIDQAAGVRRAADMGAKRIAVTVNGCSDERLTDVKSAEAEVTCLVVCTTGAEDERIGEMAECADLVWSCASDGVRRRVGEKSILQLSTAIPVFVLTRRGLDLAAGYADRAELIRGLSPERQYLVSGRPEGEKVSLGSYHGWLSEASLPVRTEREPGPVDC